MDTDRYQRQVIQCNIRDITERSRLEQQAHDQAEVLEFELRDGTSIYCAPLRLKTFELIFQTGRRKDMTAATGNAVEEAQIRALIDDRAKAVRAKDVNGAISSSAPDILSFDVVNPLQHIGSDASRKRAEDWFSSFQGPIGYEIRNLSVTAGDDVAFSHGLSHVSATSKDGGQLDMWWRTTICFRKIDGKWRVTHEHNSVPFDVESGKASLDLKP